MMAIAMMAGTHSLVAGDNDKGIDYFKAGMYSYAKPALLENVNKGGKAKAEACYYLGEIYSAENMKDSAAYYYKEGLAADPEYVFNAIGDLKLQLAANPDADKAFAGFTTGKNKKNPLIYVTIARAYMQVPGKSDKVSEYLAKAQEVGAKSPDVYILEGDILAAQNKVGDAANRYEQAIYFDDECKEAYLKYARIYTKPNPQLAIDMMNKLIEIDPEYTIAYRDLADVYYENNRFAEAAEAYSKYITPENSDIDDLSRYASILFFSGEHDKAQEIVSKVTARAPQNAVMQRLNMYISFDKGDFARSLELARNLMQNVDTAKLISRDHIYYARILSKNKDYPAAMMAYKKAIAMDTTHVEWYKELSSAAESAGQVDEAIAAQGMFLKNGGKDVKISDYFNLGKTHYIAASNLVPAEGGMAEADSMKMLEYAKVADSLFAYVAEKVPDNYLGTFWRARTNALLDPETTQGLSKPYYEAAIALLEGDPAKNGRMLIEAYRYLGYYHYIREDAPESIKYWEKILEIDPNHEMAKSALQALKQ